MPTIEPEAGTRIIERTLREVRTRRERRRKRLVFSGALGLAAVAGVALGLLVKPGAQPKRLAVPLPEVPSLVVDAEVLPVIWQQPKALLLVVNENGMEMKALSEEQLAALARKPGCEFAFTSDAVMWASEYGIGGDGFSPGAEF